MENGKWEEGSGSKFKVENSKVEKKEKGSTQRTRSSAENAEKRAIGC
jgi:hypothetical protein